MFSELFDKMFAQRWPEAEGTITRAYLDPNTRGGLTVAYEFSIGGDGPYTGESYGAGVVDIDSFKIGTTVTVRYRKDDPSVNKIDPGCW